MDNIVGVVIPTYNRLEETKRAVNSVLAQTTKVSQVVVVDDGSDENLVIALRAFLGENDVRLIEIAHSGNPGKVRRAGIKELSTEYVAFLDSDDIWMPEKIEKQIAILKSSNSDAVCSNAQIIGIDKPKLYFESKRKERLTFSNLVKKNLVICSSAIVRRSILESCDGFADNMAVQGAEDYATWLRVACFTNWIYLDEPLVGYSRESVDHFSTSTYNRPEIQAYIDFIFWHNSNSTFSKIKRKILLGGLRFALPRGSN